MYRNLFIYYGPIETDTLAVVVLDQEVCEFDLLQPIRDSYSYYGVLYQYVCQFIYYTPLETDSQCSFAGSDCMLSSFLHGAANLDFETIANIFFYLLRL